MFSEIIVPKNKNIELTPVCPRNFHYRKKKKKNPKKLPNSTHIVKSKIVKSKRNPFPNSQKG